MVSVQYVEVLEKENQTIKKRMTGKGGVGVGVGGVGGPAVSASRPASTSVGVAAAEGVKRGLPRSNSMRSGAGAGSAGSGGATPVGFRPPASSGGSGAALRKTASSATLPRQAAAASAAGGGGDVGSGATTGTSAGAAVQRGGSDEEVQAEADCDSGTAQESLREADNLREADVADADRESVDDSEDDVASFVRSATVSASQPAVNRVQEFMRLRADSECEGGRGTASPWRSWGDMCAALLPLLQWIA